MFAVREGRVFGDPSLCLTVSIKFSILSDKLSSLLDAHKF
jgi:hypothetical protein